MRRLIFRPDIPALAPSRGEAFSILAGKPLGVSSDVMPLPTQLNVVSTHSNAINCSDSYGRRWTLIADPIDFLPRTVLLDVLPEVKHRDLLHIDLTKTEAIFQTGLRCTKIWNRWHNLIEEWSDFLYEEELLQLHSHIESGEPLHTLSGLGPGLTPAGDDFITGWLTAKHCSGSPDARFEIRGFCESWSPHSTNWFSQWMVKDAVRGRIWRRGTALVTAMERGSGAVGALNDILAWGHTSGRAWLAGFAQGFAAHDAAKEMVACRK